MILSKSTGKFLPLVKKAWTTLGCFPGVLPFRNWYSLKRLRKDNSHIRHIFISALFFGLVQNLHSDCVCHPTAFSKTVPRFKPWSKSKWYKMLLTLIDQQRFKSIYWYMIILQTALFLIHQWLNVSNVRWGWSQFSLLEMVGLMEL